MPSVFRDIAGVGSDLGGFAILQYSRFRTAVLRALQSCIHETVLRQDRPFNVHYTPNISIKFKEL